MDKEKVKIWLKDRQNQYLVGLMLFTVILRLYYFFKLGSQPIWWDEGDYLALSKVWALDISKPEWLGHFTGMRPLFIPITWFLMFKTGFSEFAIRFLTILLPSILSIYFIYAVARDMYNKKVALIAGLISSVYWVSLFYSFRLLTDLPAMFFAMLTIYFFYSIYYIRGKNYGLYLSVFFGVLTFATRFPHASILITCFIFLVIIEKFNFFKNKTNWKAILLIILFLSPYLIYFLGNNFYLFRFYFSSTAPNLKIPLSQAIKDIFGMIPSLLGPSNSGAVPFIQNILLIFSFVGLASLYEFFIGFDIFLKQKEKKFNADFFILLWIFIQLFLYIVIFRTTTDRWILMLMPPLFILIAKGFVFMQEILEKYSKEISALAIVILVLIGLYIQFNHGTDLINMKIGSYGEIKQSGLWLKANTPADSKIMTASIVQNFYYSERQSFDFRTNDTIWSICSDDYGAVNTNSTCQEETEKTFNEKVKRIDPDYFIISAFEPVFTPQWAYTYPQRHNLTFVAAYPPNTQQPLLIIYKF